MQHFKVIFAGPSGKRRARKFIERDVSTNVGTIGHGGTRCDNPSDAAQNFAKENWRKDRDAFVQFFDTQDPTQTKWKSINY